MGGRTREQKRCCTSRSLLIMAVLIPSCIFSSLAVDEDMAEKRVMGISYGRIADNIPSPPQAVALMKQMKIGKVRIYDANHEVLAALAHSGLETAISVTTDLIGGISANTTVADQWIANNIVAYPNTQVKYIIVGNELFSNPSQNVTWYRLLPAMNNLHTSLLSRGLSDTVKITTCLAMDILGNSYPPSTGSFRTDIATQLMQPILKFISTTHSTFFLNVYPYLAWAANPVDVSINYALFETGSSEVTVVDGQLKYNSLLDAQVDAVIAAMARVGYGDTKLAIGETGWPTAGQLGANFSNAAKYNQRLVRRNLSTPPVGTPRRPGQFFATYLFALFNEDQKPGAAIERHWGLRFPNGSAVYSIDLTGH